MPGASMRAGAAAALDSRLRARKTKQVGATDDATRPPSITDRGLPMQTPELLTARPAQQGPFTADF